VHPTQFAVSINGLDQVAELERERDEAVGASCRDVAVFLRACHAKGYTSPEQIRKALNVPLALVKEWIDEIGRVPAVFFSILANAPTKRDREKELRGMMAEAKRRVRAEDKRRAQAERRKKQEAQHKLAEHDKGAPSPDLTQWTPPAGIDDYNELSQW
jgi:hypothetical protein